MENTSAKQHKPKLWHCHDTRSLRPLWTMEEMGIDYDLECMTFPPRYTQPGYKDLNILGTVPYFEHGETRMTESSAICHYLVERFNSEHLTVRPDNPAYGDFLNWMYMSDATLLFPQTLVLRYSRLEPEDRRLPQVVEDYRVWYWARLKKLAQHIQGRTFLCDNRFTIADIAVGYALYFGTTLGLDEGYSEEVSRYLNNLIARPGFKRISHIGKALNPFLKKKRKNGVRFRHREDLTPVSLVTVLEEFLPVKPD